MNKRAAMIERDVRAYLAALQDRAMRRDSLPGVVSKVRQACPGAVPALTGPEITVIAALPGAGLPVTAADLQMWIARFRARAATSSGARQESINSAIAKLQQAAPAGSATAPFPALTESELSAYLPGDCITLLRWIPDAIPHLDASNQTDMAQVQSLMNRYNQTFDVFSNFVARYSTRLGTIMGNLR